MVSFKLFMTRNDPVKNKQNNYNLHVASDGKWSPTEHNVLVVRNHQYYIGPPSLAGNYSY